MTLGGNVIIDDSIQEADVEMRYPIGSGTMADAVEVLEQIGMIKRSDCWKQRRETDPDFKT